MWANILLTLIFLWVIFFTMYIVFGIMQTIVYCLNELISSQFCLNYCICKKKNKLKIKPIIIEKKYIIFVGPFNLIQLGTKSKHVNIV